MFYFIFRFAIKQGSVMRFLLGTCIFISLACCINLLPIDVQVNPQSKYIENLTHILQNASFNEIKRTRLTTVNETAVRKCLDVECPEPYCFWMEAAFEDECMLCACG